jgi:CRP-like cAMP-binding protein
MFAFLDIADHPAVARHAQVVERSAGGAITREGSLTTDFFVLLSGEATLSNTEDGGEPVAVSLVRPGKIFGELGTSLDALRTSTVVAARHSQLLRFDLRAFDALQAARLWFTMA